MVRDKIFRGDRLKHAREQRDLTQIELADMANIGQNQVYRYEVGQAEPSPKIMADLAHVLKVSVDWLLGLTDIQNQTIDESDLTHREQLLLAAFRRGDLRDLMRLAAEQPDTEETN